MNTWFEIKAKQDSADLFIYDDIGGFGMPASWLVNRLQALTGKALNVYINSRGGDVFDGIALYNALSRHEGGVSVIVDGIAASIASVLAQAGTSRTMGKSSALMIHDAWGVAIGNAETMEQARAQFDFASVQIADIYATKAGGTSDEWRQKMKDETWYNAEQAREAGLADSVAGATNNAYAGRIFNLSKFNKVPDWVNQADTDDNPPEPGPEPDIHSEEDTMSDEIRQALGLGDEGDVIAAINALKSQAQDIATGEKGEANQAKRELSEARQRYIALDNQMNSELGQMRERVVKAETDLRVERALNAGRITPAAVEYVTKEAQGMTDDQWTRFLGTLPKVDLSEKGRMADETMAMLEPTAEEIKLGEQAGLTRDQIIKQKARDLGLKVPS